ncbi:T9SS type A sorting domain-containing protein [Chryseobacterium sp. NRRL B-14859]|uniref:T9SS type A sorting domain-containing protein n=1 Tax=Chryseobacterium sp. NRRL B-14859 TaxID=1562763 RepID=UPI0033941319
MVDFITFSNKNAKKIFCLLIGFFFSVGLLHAQNVQNYSFSQSQGTFSPLANPTGIATATAQSGTGAVDDNVYTLPTGTIPFNFTFNGASYTGLNVYANGFISFGSEITNNSQPISSSIAYNGVVAPLSGGDLIALYNQSGLTGNISYEIIGSAPNREFVVQWQHFTLYSSTGYSLNRYDLNFQARLHENGSITFIYNAAATGTPSSISARVGLRGSSSSDYITRSATGTASSKWDTTVAGTSSTSGIYTNSSYLPPSGLSFTFTPPAPCNAPTSQPTNLNLTNTGIIINGTFTAASPAADRYLVLRNVAGTVPNAPANGTTYTTGENTTLNSYVAYYGPDTTFQNNYNNGIKGNTEYNYIIYSVNSNCTGGPLYYTQNPLTGNIINCPITVNSIVSSNITADSFSLSWPQTENGNALPFNTVVEVATDSGFTNMVTGSPFSLNGSTLSLTINGLQANTQYYYRAKNVSSQCESAYSTVGNLYTACLPVSDLYENFDSVTGNVLPNCWSKITVGVTSSTPTVNVTSTYANSAPNGVTFYGNGADMTNLNNLAILVSPQLTNVGSGLYRLKFNAKMSSSGGTYDIRIVALSSNTSNATIEEIAVIPHTQLTTAYQEFIVNFNSYSGSAQYIGIQRINGSSYSYLCVDDVIWEPIPACPDLSGITLNYATPDGANISWTAAGTPPADGYEYFVSATSTPPSSGTFTPINSNTTTVTGLPNGTYYFWVRGICSATEKSAWKMLQFSTVPTAPAPWTEDFLTSSYPQGWATTGWSLGTVRGASGIGNSAMNLYKNLYGSQTTGNFSTIPVGPLNSATYELSFYYKQSAFSTPYAPLTDWGNYTVQVSTDFGNTWNTIDTVDNESGTGAYIKKVYSLANYTGEYVQVKITANRTAGDYDLSFDQFEIKDPNSLSTVENNISRDTISVYPIPTDSLLYIESPKGLKSFEIYDLSGKRVMTGAENTVNISSLLSGMYLIRIIGKDQNVTTKKIIKK